MVVVITLGVLVFWNTLHGAFQFDDFASIRDNQTIRSLWPLTAPLSPPGSSESVAGRPLANFSLAVNYAAGGLEVTGYHLVNIGIHLACALVLFALVRETLTRTWPAASAGRDAIAAATAAIWMVHPLQSEPVNYLVARTESLMALGLLSTVYLAARDRPGWALVSCAAGMACKETMVVAPALVVAYDRAYSFVSWRDCWRARGWFYLALAATWLVLAALLWSGPRGGSAGLQVSASISEANGSWSYLLNQALIIPRYLRLLLWPSDLVLDYGFPAMLTMTDVWFGGLIVIALVIATLVAWWRAPSIGYLGIWAFATLAPTSSVVPIVTEVGAERRMYLPAMSLVCGAVIVAAVALRRAAAPVRARMAIGTVAVVAVVLLLSIATSARAREYRSGLAMWTTVVERRPHGRAFANLAAEQEAAGQRDEVLPLLEKAVRDFPDAEYDLGLRLREAGRHQEAIRHLEAFLSARPTHYKAAGAKTLLMRSWTDLGIQFVSSGDHRQALSAFERALSYDANNPDLQRNLATALLDGGDRDGAARHALEALKLRPGDPVASEILAAARAPLPR